MFALKRPHVGLFCFRPAFYSFVVAEKILATFIVLCCLLAELDCQSKLFFFSGAALPPCNRKGALSRVQVHKRHVCCRFQCRNGAKKQKNKEECEQQGILTESDVSSAAHLAQLLLLFDLHASKQHNRLINRLNDFFF